MCPKPWIQREGLWTQRTHAVPADRNALDFSLSETSSAFGLRSEKGSNQDVYSWFTESIQVCVIMTNKTHFFFFFSFIYFNNHPLHVSNRLTIRNMQRVITEINFKRSASCWYLLRNYIKMHGPQNVKKTLQICCSYTLKTTCDFVMGQQRLFARIQDMCLDKTNNTSTGV